MTEMNTPRPSERQAWAIIARVEQLCFDLIMSDEVAEQDVGRLLNKLLDIPVDATDHEQQLRDHVEWTSRGIWDLLREADPKLRRELFHAWQAREAAEDVAQAALQQLTELRHNTEKN